MANAWGDVVYPADGHGHFQVGVEAVAVSQTDAAVTYEVRCLYRTWWGYYVHSTWRVWADDGGSMGNYLDYSASYELDVKYLQSRVPGSCQVTFERRDADYTAWFGASFQQHGGYGDGTGSALLSLTVPARPKYPPNPPSITSAGRDSSGGIVLAISVNSSTATQMQVQRQASGSDAWAQVYSGAPVSSYTEAPGAGSYRYRARNGNADGWSAWGAETQ